jgi:7-cyano-7-deazaguanine synthase
MTDANQRAVVLLSGGLDSATVLAIAAAEGRTAIALSVDYGQRHRTELQAAATLARRSGVEHVCLRVDLRTIGDSALTSDEPVPKSSSESAAAIPRTYVPARNTIFLSLALGLAEARDAGEIWIGVNAVDYSGYPDCRPEYVAAFERMAALATRRGVEGRPVRIVAPLSGLRKDEIIRRGVSLGVDYGLTRSCYDPDAAGRACGHCESCGLRLAAFSRLGMGDPAPYSAP